MGPSTARTAATSSGPWAMPSNRARTTSSVATAPAMPSRGRTLMVSHGRGPAESADAIVASAVLRPLARGPTIRNGSFRRSTARPANPRSVSANIAVSGAVVAGSDARVTRLGRSGTAGAAATPRPRAAPPSASSAARWASRSGAVPATAIWSSNPSGQMARPAGRVERREASPRRIPGTSSGSALRSSRRTGIVAVSEAGSACSRSAVTARWIPTARPPRAMA